MKILLLVVALIGIVGCVATNNSFQEKWDSRLGRMTYDEMVARNGPPLSKEVLANGDTVGVWGGTRTVSTPAVTFNHSDNPWLPAATTYGGTTRAVTEKMVCTFGENQVLKAWNFSKY